MTHVKICGMMRPSDVIFASRADYLGFIVSSSSRRCLSESRAGELMGLAYPKKVMVTTCPDVGEIKRMANELRPDVVQAHRIYSLEEMEKLRSCIACELWLLLPVQRSISMSLIDDLRNYADKVVLDTPSGSGGGSGLTHDWEISSTIVRSLRPKGSVLAGGLGPSNVRLAIEKVRPDVVDVSSGVEEGGTKSPGLIAEFIDLVHGVQIGGS